MKTNQSIQNFGAYNGLLVSFGVLNSLQFLDESTHILDYMDSHHFGKAEKRCELM